MNLYQCRSSSHIRLQRRIEALETRLHALKDKLDEDVQSVDVMRMAAAIDSISSAIDMANSSITVRLAPISEDDEEIPDGAVFSMEAPKAKK